MKKLIDLANHILAMQNDAYFLGHPEWYSIISKAENALKSIDRGNKIALLKDIQDNYDMGLITKAEYHEQINNLS